MQNDAALLIDTGLTADPSLSPAPHIRRQRRAAALAWTLCACTVLLCLATIQFALLNRVSLGFTLQLTALSGAVTSAYIAARHPRNTVGWVLLGGMCCYALGGLLVEYGLYRAATQPGAVPFAAYVGNLVLVPLGSAVLIVVLPFIFPDGRFVSARWRFVFALVLVCNAIVMLLEALRPGPSRGLAQLPSPFGLAALAPYQALVDGVIEVLAVVMLGCAMLSLVSRYRWSPFEQRLQLKWLMYVVIAWLALIVVYFVVEHRHARAEALVGVLLDLTFLCYPLAIAIAIARYRLYDIDRLINRTLLYGALTGVVVAIYVGVVAAAGAVFQAQGSPLVALLATGVVAVLFQPLRAALQRSVNRLVYGRRDEPYQVLALLSQRLEGALAAQDMLPAVASTVRDALRLPYVAVTRYSWDGETVVSVSGEPLDGAVAFPLVVQHEPIGRLLVAQRAPDEPFTGHERRLLASLAQHISITAHAVRLTDDLQRSRERLVAAREEERRRLQRDLHDGLGPTLASLSMQLDAARASLGDDPAASEALMAEVQAELKETVGTVRRLVHQLRPPMLDQLGLCGAIREHTLWIERGSELRLLLELPPRLPLISAAVEVAAYYIVVEALNNAVRHAQARRCTVRLRVAMRQLHVEVSDDGVGLPEQVLAGVGLRSMRERAREVGGSCRIAGATGGGVAVHARLPVVADDER